MPHANTSTARVSKVARTFDHLNAVCHIRQIVGFERRHSALSDRSSSAALLTLHRALHHCGQITYVESPLQLIQLFDHVLHGAVAMFGKKRGPIGLELFGRLPHATPIAKLIAFLSKPLGYILERALQYPLDPSRHKLWLAAVSLVSLKAVEQHEMFHSSFSASVLPARGS